jgi:hypothetical protein
MHISFRDFLISAFDLQLINYELNFQTLSHRENQISTLYLQSINQINNKARINLKDSISQRKSDFEIRFTINKPIKQ